MVKRCYVITFILILSISSLAYGIKEIYSSVNNKGVDKTLWVEKVYDGDTIGAVVDAHFEKIRLIGIDAPEMEQRPWGRQAKECIEDILRASASKVSLEYDFERRDKYGRILAYIWTQDGMMLNEELLKKGCTVLFTVPPNVKYIGRLRFAQKKARDLKAGIWSENGLKERPYDFRKEHPRR